MSKIYAVIGTSQQTIIADTVSYQQQVNEVLMKSERPEGDYIANKNGEWVKDTSKEIEALDSQYNSDKAILMSQYTEAVIDDDSELMASVKAELTALREQYDKDYEDIIGGAD
jgi:hypothetical protein